MSLFDRDIHHILASQVYPSLRILPRFFSVVKYAKRLYTNSLKIKWVFVLQIVLLCNFSYADTVSSSTDQLLSDLISVVGSFWDDWRDAGVGLTAPYTQIYSETYSCAARLNDIKSRLTQMYQIMSSQTNSTDYSAQMSAITNFLWTIDNHLLTGFWNITNSLNTSIERFDSLTNITTWINNDINSLKDSLEGLDDWYNTPLTGYRYASLGAINSQPDSTLRVEGYFNLINSLLKGVNDRLSSLNNYDFRFLSKFDTLDDDLIDVYEMLENIYNDIPDGNFGSISNNLSTIQGSLTTMISQLGTNNSWLHAISMDLSDVVLELNFANAYTLNCLDSITNSVSNIDFNIGNIGNIVTNLDYLTWIFGNSGMIGSFSDEFWDYYFTWLGGGYGTPSSTLMRADGSYFNNTSGINYYEANLGDYIYGMVQDGLPSIASINNQVRYLLNTNILQTVLLNQLNITSTNIAQHTELISNILSQEIYTNLLKQVSWQERIFNAVTNLSLVVSNSYPTVDMSWTNDFQTLVTETTNHFSLFKRQYFFDDTPALEGADLSDPSEYYTYLTNYYINVVSPPPSVGHTFTRTNWFNRIEILLASIAFSVNGTNSMTNDVSKIESSEDLVSSAETSFNEITTKNATFISKFGTNLQKLFDHIGLFTSTVGTITAPPNTILISAEIDGDTGGGEPSPFSTSIEYKIPSSDTDWAEIKELIRSITGLCWSVFGFWFVIKYLVFVSEIIAFLTGFLVSAIGELKSS